ncbi:single-stranded DNA-binding protein [Corynebacterium incognita]|uniref:Single-stranded DNA-binding protein n=1 Tax=Corynebacterium incognita TaxID=2754725 RepID=A0A7G7CRR9_9CORY|nr:single-stranded DNA-binding protein [Corynebacterium incognita]QNE90285.1 single-stranded DNA-binding protein [Corynebacterium incognita]
MAIEIITITGGLTRDPELRFTPQGAGVAEFSIAQSDNRYNEQTKQWEKTRALYLDVTIWNETSDRKQNPTPWAELSAELQQGDQVAVTGKLFTHSWDTRDGDKRTKIKFLATKFYRMPRTNTPAQGMQQAQNNVQQTMNQPAANNWEQPTTPGGFGSSGEPPF